MSHYEQRLERDLQQVRDEVSQLARSVESAVGNAVHALLTGNVELANATVLADGHINRAMRRIDKLCHSFIAVHLPSAGHLRLISSVLRSNIMLERIGDYAVTICRETCQLSAAPSGPLAHGIENMANLSRQMLGQAVQAFERGDAVAARSAIAMAGQVQASFTLRFEDLLDEAAPWSLKDRFALFVIFHRLERMSDQAKNLCEEVVFSSTGQPKQPKVYRILFLDEDNSCLGQIAEGIARKRYPALGQFDSAGRLAAATLNPGMVTFMDARGVDMADAAPTALDLTAGELSEYHVIVSLQGQVGDYIPALPFHTVALAWDVGDAPGPLDAASHMDDLHRRLSVLIRDLMVELRGGEAVENA